MTVNDPGDDANASTGMYLGGGNYGLDVSSNTLTADGLPGRGHQPELDLQPRWHG